MSFDLKCHKLADSFLAGEDDAIDTKSNVSALAQRIQDIIEEFIEEKKYDLDAAALFAKDEAVDRAIDERQLGEDI